MGRDRKSDEQRRARHAAIMLRWRAKQRLRRLVRKPNAKRDGNSLVSIEANHIQELRIPAAHVSKSGTGTEWPPSTVRSVRHQPDSLK